MQDTPAALIRRVGKSAKRIKKSRGGAPRVNNKGFNAKQGGEEDREQGIILSTGQEASRADD